MGMKFIYALAVAGMVAVGATADECPTFSAEELIAKLKETGQDSLKVQDLYEGLALGVKYDDFAGAVADIADEDTVIDANFITANTAQINADYCELLNL